MLDDPSSLPPRLELLNLGQCGRGMGSRAAAALAGPRTAATGPALPCLQLLALAGAYRLTDDALETLVCSAPMLAELCLPNCSRLQGASIQALPSVTPRLR